MASLRLSKLTNRTILKITGPDTYPYLQSLVCNDVRHLYEPERIPEKNYAFKSSNVMSTFMLNPLGRSICDMIIYRTPSTRTECEFTPPGKATKHDELLIECDSTLASGLANTLFGYRVRRKVSISIEDHLSVFSVYPNLVESNPLLDSSSRDALMSTNQLETSLVSTNEVVSNEFIMVQDPRLSSLGVRIVSCEKDVASVKQSISSMIGHDILEASTKAYTRHRYFLGVGEGVLDHPESDCLPLECNADLLNSVSFTKGCYLGQELTARIHYTGVVRKRLMPVIITEPPTDTALSPPIPGSELTIEGSVKRIGTLKNFVKNRGLVLLRHGLLNDENINQIVHSGSKMRMTAYRPFWWPTEQIKEN